MRFELTGAGAPTVFRTVALNQTRPPLRRLVGVAGFEPAISASQAQRVTNFATPRQVLVEGLRLELRYPACRAGALPLS